MRSFFLLMNLTVVHHTSYIQENAVNWTWDIQTPFPYIIVPY